jgi:hypothetical protein
MSRFAGRVFAVIAGVSLMLCMTTVAVWVRSYFRDDVIFFRDVVLRSHDGVLELRRYAWRDPARSTIYITDIGPVAFAPHGVLAALFAVAPAAWLMARRVRKRRAHQRGLCPVCSYDLRASPERCPECGTPREPAPQRGHL